MLRVARESCVLRDLLARRFFVVCRGFKQRRCPECGYMAYRDKVFTRRLRDLGDLAADRPRELLVSYSPALLFPLPELFQRGFVGPGRMPQQPLHPSGGTSGGAPSGRGGRPAVPCGVLASVGATLGLRSLCHAAELGGGRGKKRPPNASPAITWTGRGSPLLGLHRRR